MDWALVNITNIGMRTIENLLSPKEIPFATASALTIPTQLRSYRFCPTWSNVNIRDQRILVGKFGRTSGWTFGHLNAALVEFNGDEQVQHTREPTT